MKTNIIHNEECIQGMKKMGDDSVDITITSPPYNIGKSIHHEKNMYKEYKDNIKEEEYYNFIKESLTEMIRLTKHYVFLNFQMLSNNKISYMKIISDFKDQIKEFFIWAKTNPAPAIKEGCFNSGFEFIICFSKNDNIGRTFKHHYTQQGKQSNTIIKSTYKKLYDGEFTEGHFACFPKWLPRFFIENFSKEEDIIFDPFAGTGTTQIVAKELNRKYLGFEISKEYIEIFDKRIRQGNMKQWF